MLLAQVVDVADDSSALEDAAPAPAAAEKKPRKRAAERGGRGRGRGRGAGEIANPWLVVSLSLEMHVMCS